MSDDRHQPPLTVHSTRPGLPWIAVDGATGHFVRPLRPKVRLLTGHFAAGDEITPQVIEPIGDSRRTGLHASPWGVAENHAALLFVVE